MRLIAVAGLMLPLACVCGCGSVGRPQSLAARGPEGASATDTESADANPFRRTLAEQAAVGEPAELAAATTDPPPGSALFESNLDAATQTLIDQELADATPDERRELLAEFENIEPAMVRQLLRIRRMVRQVGHHTARGSAGLVSAGDSPPPEHESTAPSTATVGYSRGGPVASVAGGLGDVSPWQNAAPPEPRTHGPVYAGEPAPTPPGGQHPGSLPAFPGPAAPPAPVQLLPAEPEAEATRATSALARMVPRLDAFPNLFPMGGAEATPEPQYPAPTGSSPSIAPAVSPAGTDAGGQHELEHLIARLEADVQHLPPPAGPDDPSAAAYVEAQVFLRMLYLIAGHQEQAIAHIPGVSPAVQQFWQQMLWAMANAFDVEHMPDQSERAAQTLLQLQAAAVHLREQAPLKLDNIAFCTKITSFGNYDRFDPYEFSPGQPVLLYAEVENFLSEATTDQQGQNAFRTILQSRVEILSPSGDIHFQMDFPPTEDLCRARRRDYFHSYEFTIPPRMPYGHHVLVLTVEDRVSRKVATYRLNFTVK